MGLFGSGGQYFVYRAITSEDEATGEIGVPSYRCYGVTRRKHQIVETAAFLILSAMALWIFGVCILALLTFFLAVLDFGTVLSKTFLVGGAILLLVWLNTRLLRKRMRFVRRMRRFCKKNRMNIQKNKPFLLAFLWEGEQPDFLIDTREARYAVHFLSIKKRRSALFLEKKDTMKLVSYPLNNIFTVIFGFQPKVRYYPLVPVREGESTAYGREIRRIVLLNPTCREMFEKNADGMTVPTGSGASFCGYTVYTGSGFLNALEREAPKKK